MFEQSIVLADRPAARIALLPLSIAVHAFLFSAVLLLTIWRISFPLDAPSQIEIRESIAPVPMPLEAPRLRAAATRSSAAKPAARPAVAMATPALAAQVVTPSAIPSALPLPSAVVGSGSETGPADGPPASIGSSTDREPGVGLPADPAGPMPVVGDVVAPQLLVRIPPVYPSVAIALRREGVVVLSCIIDRDGTVRSVTPVRDDFPPFRESAIEAVRKWRFRPGSLRGRPIDTIFELRVDFRFSE